MYLRVGDFLHLLVLVLRLLPGLEQSMLQVGFGLVDKARHFQLEAPSYIVDLLSADTSLQYVFALCDPMHSIDFEILNDVPDLGVVFDQRCLIFTDIYLQITKLLSNNFAGPILIVLHCLIVFGPFDAHLALAFKLVQLRLHLLAASLEVRDHSAHVFNPILEPFKILF